MPDVYVAAVCVTVLALSALAGLIAGGIWYVGWGRPGRGWRP